MPSKLNILAASYVPNNPDAGNSGYLHRWSQALKERGHHVDLVFGDDPDAWPFLKKWTSPPHIFWAFPFKIVKHLLETDKKYDVIQINEADGFLPWLIERYLHKNKNCLFVMKSMGLPEKHHEVIIEEAKNGFGRVRLRNKIWMTIFRFLPFKFSLMLAQQLHAGASSDIEWMKKRHGLEDFRAVHLLSGTHPEFLLSTAPPRKSDIVLYVGGWLPAKGVQYLKKALLSIKDFEWKLMVIGAGKTKDDIYADFPPEYHNRLLIIPPCSTDDLRRYYEEANCLAHPTLSDSMPSSPMEAAACGCPVIGSNSFGLDDIFEHNVTATLIPIRDVTALKNALENHLSHPPQIRKQVEAAKEMISLLTWEKTAEDFEKIVFDFFEKSTSK